MSSTEFPFIVGSRFWFENLAVVPLVSVEWREREYDTLDEALTRGSLTISEVSDAGHVPEISMRNDGSRPVLVIDGEELVGAKQNRTVNLSILIGAGSHVVVPVTCVEAGRWRSRTAHFNSAPRTHFAAGRAAKSAQVTASLMATGVARANQAQVWDAIAHKSARLGTSSDTGAMADMFTGRTRDVDAYVAALPAACSQLGAIFLIDGEPVGADIFQHSETYAVLASKIVRGYALDALDSRTNAANPTSALVDRSAQERAEAFLSRVLGASRRRFDSIGVGETWRLLAPGLAGGALTFNDRLLHLSAFRV